MLSVDTYEVLVVEDDVYYVRFYPEGMECRGINIRLSEEHMEVFIVGKVEV